ncbi:transcriptional regulator [Nesterenkonia sp. AN1]|uniref:TetR family transcriptional regulator n=1 Tax=Nesterenkonia aurantiaca TaxID=1436010 RepID=A0A4R7G6H2_9MICC|nr:MULTISPECIES: TetR/AcrR family transcriptional regulator [Nesterenkonia]EXF24016.1 transcriptional regulator [Nesterenkonia sp. AN1]TDS86898.1 TetR family transcriptional regulator [Nesterenkonia aurantiaca]
MSTVQQVPARTRLLQAADRILFEEGIRATPVDEILRQAQVSPATLYAHFGSKDALIAEALRVRFADWRSTWDEHVISANDDTERLLAVFDARAAYAQTPQHPERWCAFLATATEMMPETGEIREVLDADTALLRTRLLHLSRPLAGDHAQDLADAVLLAYNGALTAFLRGHPRSPITAGKRLAGAAVQAYTQS